MYMVSNSKDKFFINVYSPIPLCLCSHLDLIVNLEIIRGDVEEDSEAKESRKM